MSDDNSPRQDEIRKVCEAFNNKENFRYYLLDENLGEIGNKRNLLQHANGEYICFIGDDDIINHCTLDQFISEHDCCKDYDLHLFGFNVVNDHGEFISRYQAHVTYDITTKDSKIKKLVYRSSSLPLWHFHPATYICNRKVAIKLGFSNNFGMAEDLNFIWESLKTNIRTKVNRNILFAWRKHVTIAQVNQSKIPLNNIYARWRFLEAIRLGVHAEEDLGLSESRLVDHLVLGPIARELSMSTVTKTQIIDMFGDELREYKRLFILLRLPKVYLLYFNIIRAYAFISTFGFRAFAQFVRHTKKNESKS